MVLTQIPPLEHFFDSMTRWIGPEGGDSDTFTMTGWDPARQTIISRSRLPRNVQNIIDRPLHPSQTLKTNAFAPAAVFTAQEVILISNGS